MDYRLPTAEDEELLKEYIVEHYAHGERSISASHGLPVSEYSEWVRTIENNALQGSEE